MAYVISKWDVSDTGSLTDNNYISIKGRNSGVLSWLFTLVGIEPSVSIYVNSNSIFFEKGSLAGFEKKVIPIATISSAYYGFTKPWKEALSIGFIMFLPTMAFAIVLRQNNLLIALFLMLLGPIAGFLIYIFDKTIKIGFVESGGMVSGIEFKPSFIEGKRFYEKEAHKVINVIQQLINNANKIQTTAQDSVNTLANLAKLYQQGMITVEEYESNRQNLLRNL